MDSKRTYTFTARNYYDPDKVVTFTLVDHYLKISFAELGERLARVAAADEKSSTVMEQVKSSAESLRVKVMEQITGPFHVADTRVKLDDDHLIVKGWNRVLGMRLTPYSVDLGRVDNPDAAEDFVDKLREQQESVPAPGPFRGPLNYWFAWIGLFVVIGFTFGWVRRQR